MSEPKRMEVINVADALGIIETEMDVGFKVALERKSDLLEVKNDVETKLYFLYKLNCIHQDELDSMLALVHERYESERRKQ